MPIKKQLQHAQSLHQQGRLDEALQQYLEILEQNPEDINIIQLVCLLYVQQNNLPGAAAFIHAAIMRRPQEASLYNSLGNVLSRQAELDDAIKAYRKALSITPDYPGALNNLGNCYFRQQQWARAKACYEEALHIDADYPDAHFNLARLYLQESLTAEATTHLEQVIEIAPQHAGALGQLGNIYLAAENLQLAIPYLQRRVAIQPHAETYQSLATAYIHLKDYHQAIEALENALALNPQQDEALHMLATAYLLSGNLDQATKYYLRQLEQKPHLESLYNIAVLFSDKQRHNEAIAYFEQALLLDPKHLASHLNLAAVYLRQHKTNKAIQHYKIAAMLDPENLEIKHILHALTQDHVPSQAPTAFVSNLFDQYAPNYDKHLQEHLDYQVPRELHRQLIDTINPQPHSLRILDLGCGTGLSGELFQAISRELIGIDVSATMLDIARHKNIYQELIHEPIEIALDRFSEMDVVIAADVFPYLGDLKNIFEKVTHCLRQGGWFLFSIEKTLATHPYVLQKTIRYAHNKNYIKSLCSECKLELLELNNVILRKQQKKPLEGYLFLVKKP